MKNKQLIVFAIVSLTLTLWAYQAIFSPNNQMLGTPAADTYQGFQVILKDLEVIKSGNLPFGVFWLPDFYGGSIATYFHVSFLPGITCGSLTLINAITNNLVLTLKIVTFLGIVVAQFFSYKLAKFYFKKTSIAWIFSIAYSFSTFFPSVTNGGHIAFFLAAAIMPGALLLFEKMFTSPNRKNMVLASLALILMFFTDLQITMFTIYYLFLRIGYQLITSPDKRLLILQRLVELSALFSLVVAPYLISFSTIQKVQSLLVLTIPTQYQVATSEFFTLTSTHLSSITGDVIASFYMGIVVFALSIIPLILFRIQEKHDRREFLFYLLVFVFFLLIALGTPLSTIVTQLFVRVPSRAQVMVVFCLSMCACYGVLCLSKLFESKLPRLNSLRLKSILKSKPLQTLIAIGLVLAIFVDLGLPISTITSPVPQLSGGHEYIASQPDNFRILKYPIVWGYSNYESALINHEILGVSIIAIRTYPDASELYIHTIHTFEALNNATEIENLTLLSTICGVKYVLIETIDDQSSKYLSIFNNASGYFSEVYRDDQSVVYENLYYKGQVFALKNEGQQLSLDNMTLANFSELLIANQTIKFNQDFNTMTLSGNLPQRSNIIISQAYSPFWVQANDGTAAFTKVLNVTAYQADQGSFKVEAIFSAADQTSNLYVVFTVALILCGTALVASSFGKKDLLRFTLSLSTAFGAIVMLLSFMATSYAPQSLRMLGVFSGVFNNVLLLFGVGIVVISLVCLIRSRLLLALKRTLATISLFLRDSKPKVMAQKMVFVIILITSLALIVSAFYFQATQTDIMRLQLQTIIENQTETYVSLGTQFSLSGSGTALLTAALIMFAGLGLAVGYQLYSEIKSGTLTTKAVEFIGFIGLSAAVVFVIGNGGLMASADLINNQLVGLFAVVFPLVIMEFALIFYRPVVLLTVSAAQKKIVAADEIIGLLLKTLLAASLFFILLVNVTSAVPEGLTWLDNNMAYVMVSILILYVLSQGIYSGGYKTGLSAAPLDIIKPDSGVKRLHLGIFGGIIGVFLAGVLMRVLTLQTQNVVVSALVICAALGGLGFGALTNGSKKLRGIIGCIFGSIAIIFGLVMTYTSPIIIGYSFNGAPLYKWHGSSFGEFMGNQLLSLQGVFYLLLGLMLAYLAAAYLSYRVKAKKEQGTERERKFTL